jgi:hypothetical protein
MPACPVCGGLECLCRPRFFAGQLLSEEDLCALDHYIIEKNKLHNRYLHGTGTVCGLQVVCHECNGWVTIKQGYAIDPCGNDIIVCKDYPFDVCAAIAKCCDRKRKDWDCEPMAGPPPECKDIEQCWFVTLRYREFESRGITALKSSSQPSGCGCGASDCSGGCGSGSKNGNSHGAKKRTTVSARRPAAECEPTRTCESFVVELAPAPTETPEDPLKLFAGTFLEQVLACAKHFDALKKDSTETFEIYRRSVLPTPAPAPIPAPVPAPSRPPLDQLFRDCVCRALLPPCPSDPFDPRVILACVKVQGQGNDCRILDICHWHGRQFVLTAPNMLYWASIGGLVKQVLENACCNEEISEPPPEVKADLEITEATLAFDESGGRVDCKVMVHNNGPDAAQNVIVDVTITSDNPAITFETFSPPNAWGANKSKSPFTANLVSLSASQSQEFSFKIPIAFESSGTLNLTAKVKSDTADPDLTNNDGADDLTWHPL